MNALAEQCVSLVVHSRENYSDRDTSCQFTVLLSPRAVSALAPHGGHTTKMHPSSNVHKCTYGFLLQVRQRQLLYTAVGTEPHSSLEDLYSRCERAHPTMLVIQTDDHRVFGAYCSHPWSQRYGNGGKYFGDASCFVWNARHGRVTAFKHVGRQRDGSAAATVPQMMQGEVSHMAIARGDTGQHALQIDQNLRRGLSFHTDVLKNESLAGQNAEFLISQIEVWGFGPTVEEQEAPLPETPSGEHCRAEGATDNDSDPSMWL
eukprot:m.453610 g.453610  ORF g.453610 m.453610 type:complete len:261 (-) comp21551_c0_seq5:70-852(-)